MACESCFRRKLCRSDLLSLLLLFLLLFCFSKLYRTTSSQQLPVSPMRDAPVKAKPTRNSANDFLRNRVRSLRPQSQPGTSPGIVGDSDEQLARNFNNFAHFHRLADRHMDSAMHWMDQMGTQLPLMRLAAADESAEHRAAWAERWLRTQSLAVVAAARNALPGLKTTIANLLRLCERFAHCDLVFLENDSADETRQRLYQLTRDLSSSASSRVTATLLGCGRVNSPEPCRLNVSYSTGKVHRPGSTMKRSLIEELERVQVMSALRNQLLAYTYTHLAVNHSLLLSIDPDLNWADWDLSSILQGLYYFGTRPQLDSLCASIYFCSSDKRTIYDPCTLQFQPAETTGHVKDGDLPLDSDEKRSDAVLYNGARAPVKVASCFQGLTFYRMASLYRKRLLYRKGIGEWICEHNTLSRQLSENYIDPNMQLRVRKRLGPLVL